MQNDGMSKQHNLEKQKKQKKNESSNIEISNHTNHDTAEIKSNTSKDI